MSYPLNPPFPPVPVGAMDSSASLYEWVVGHTGMSSDLFLLSQNCHILQIGDVPVGGQTVDMLPRCSQFKYGPMGISQASSPVPWFQDWLDFSGTYMTKLAGRSTVIRDWAGVVIGLPSDVWNICFSYACDIDGVVAWQIAGHWSALSLPLYDGPECH